ncbi:phosphonate ABC transporter permease [Bacillus sp. SA1-12]|uniref:putative 2-aminoethylphosphonate ABC transporter permease subunit n=1 Tax=Bacillus sp. SA1-12 TaxID=1455638 RepID=UPI000625E1B1|nr:putative 2-aminoethylphosphonate ABC transporter permease subunit [Bacillus sp. SA1-12]KKI93990.1 phosphonate ABC transporter permease [Bacillus sp. SA1-12]
MKNRWLYKMDLTSATVLRRRLKQKDSLNERLQTFLIILILLTFIALLVLPLSALFSQTVFDHQGKFVGLQNFIAYFQTASLVTSLQNTLFISLMTMIISVSLAFFYAYSLTRTEIAGKTIFRYSALLPLFAPTMMHGIALMYLFGNQGIITNGFFGYLPGIDIELYGATGIIIAEVIYTFPQAFLILFITLQQTDYRLYEAADSLGTKKGKQFLTITLPSAKYGLISSMFIVFTLSFTDYGAPKVVGGQYNVLATDIYKQVVGQQNLSMGAAVGVLLMLPALLAFLVDQLTQQKQSSYLSAKSIPYKIVKNKLRDRFAFFYCMIISGFFLLMFLAVVIAACTKMWPYNLSFTLDHFTFTSLSGDGLIAFKNSLIASALTAVFGTIITFIFAYVIEKSRKHQSLRKVGNLFSIIPLALPGLVIGISYIFFFSKPEFSIFGMTIGNPLHFLYGSIAIIVIANILHFYSVAFVTATTALKKLDKEFELVSESMGVPFYKTFFRVTVPMCIPAILEMGMYYFVNSMVTISAVVFLYTADFKLAAISIVNMDDAGNLASAAAMSVLIVLTNILVRVLYEIAVKRMKSNSKNRKYQEAA